MYALYSIKKRMISGFRARLESMSQFGEKYAKRVEERAKTKEEKLSENESNKDSTETDEAPEN